MKLCVHWERGSVGDIWGEPLPGEKVMRSQEQSTEHPGAAVYSEGDSILHSPRS